MDYEVRIGRYFAVTSERILKIMSIVLALNNLLLNYNSTVEKVFEEHDIAKMIISETVHIEELKSHLIKMVTAIMEYIEANKKTAVKNIISEAVEFIKLNYYEDISLQILSDRYFLNMAYLSRMFKIEVGLNFNEFLNKTRMEAAAELLKKDNLKAKDIAKLTGYSSSDYFFKKFKSYYKMTPSQYRNTIM